MHTQTKRRSLLTALFLGFLLCLVQAQGGPGGPGDPGGDPGGGTGVPVDGGLSLLVAAAVGYAAKKRYDKRKRETGDTTSHKEK